MLFRSAHILLQSVLVDVPQRIDALAAAIAADDDKTAHREAHTIKGQAAGGGARPLRDLAQHLEGLCREGLLQEAAERLPDLRVRYEQAAAAWRHFIAESS